MTVKTTITLEKKFTPDAKVEEFDVRQMKKALNRLGYYQPYEKTGITGIPDREVFEALKQFQKDHGLRATGEARPGDETVQALNTEIKKTPEGYYVWRTVEDGKVRNSHAQYNRTVRAWSDSPDPGEDYNCRCWAEPYNGVIRDERQRNQFCIDLSKKIRELDVEISDTIPQNIRMAEGELNRLMRQLKEWKNQFYLELVPSFSLPRGGKKFPLDLEDALDILSIQEKAQRIEKIRKKIKELESNIEYKKKDIEDLKLKRQEAIKDRANSLKQSQLLCSND